MDTMEDELSEEFCRYTLYSVAKGLEAYHDMNLIHRSINGEAVLFNSEGVKIADCSDSVFLTNEEASRPTAASSLYGWTRAEALPWAAPEMQEADTMYESEFGTTNSYGKEVDIWALGLFAYELATGTIPDASDERVIKLLEE